MIVSTAFEGDSWEVASDQACVYDLALNIIVKNCNRFALFAKHVLQAENSDQWGLINRYDHRTLQFQHDLLAIAWRYQSNAAQRKLELTGKELTASEEWLAWLNNEVLSWIDRPYYVHLVQVILANQNNNTGYEAEGRLCLEIMHHFHTVPWRIETYRAIENDLIKSFFSN